jgi:heat shock protein HtpX
MNILWNNLKTAILLGGLMGLFLLVGSQFGQQGLIVALVFGLITNFGAWFFSDKIAIASMQGHEVTRTENPGLYDLVDRLRQRASLPMPRVYICPHDAPNAFATGRSPNKAAVCVTNGLLQLMTVPELEGVLAHELTHVKNRDTLTSCIAATIAGVFSFLAQSFLFFGAGRREGGNPVFAIVALILAPIGAALIKAAISRSREFVADAGAARITGSPDGLVSALRKLEGYSKQIPLIQPNPAMNNLFIIEPMFGESVSRLFATHPPTERRIAALLSNR